MNWAKSESGKETLEKIMKFEREIEYIKNTGGEPKIQWFDEDFQPIGPSLRARMKKEGVICECDGKIFLTPKNAFKL